MQASRLLVLKPSFRLERDGWSARLGRVRSATEGCEAAGHRSDSSELACMMIRDALLCSPELVGGRDDEESVTSPNAAQLGRSGAMGGDVA